MSKIIGITGGMASGKTTLANKILERHPDFIHIDVDKFRRKLFDNEDYVQELKNKIPELRKYEKINSMILNPLIYSSLEYMNQYKTILYSYLFQYIHTLQDKTILLDWALILNDSLADYCNQVICLDISKEIRMDRLKGSDLSNEEIIARFILQDFDFESLKGDKYLVLKEPDINKIEQFLGGMECKFTLPNNEGKAIWEITHQCNYHCHYCIFSCNQKKIVGELTKEECFHIIDELVAHHFKHLKITGGEPFLRNNMIEILQYASSRLIVDISTNASLITPEKVDLLNKIKLKMIHVSLDGNCIEHESVRGKNTYLPTIRGLQALRNSINKVRIGTVIHLNNENDLEQVILDSCNLCADEIIFSIMEPVGEQDKSFIKTKENDELISILQQLKKQYESMIEVNYNFGKQPQYITSCPAGEKFLYINNFGQISPCPWVSEKNPACISQKSLKDYTLDEVMQEKQLVKFLIDKKRGTCYGKI